MPDRDLPSLEEWCQNSGLPLKAVRGPSGNVEYICDESAPLAQRLNVLRASHPTSICRRDRVAIMAALEAIDGLTSEVASLRAELARITDKEAGDA